MKSNTRKEHIGMTRLRVQRSICDRWDVWGGTSNGHGNGTRAWQRHIQSLSSNTSLQARFEILWKILAFHKSLALSNKAMFLATDLPETRLNLWENMNAIKFCHNGYLVQPLCQSFSSSLTQTAKLEPSHFSVHTLILHKSFEREPGKVIEELPCECFDWQHSSSLRCASHD